MSDHMNDKPQYGQCLALIHPKQLDNVKKVLIGLGVSYQVCLQISTESVRLCFDLSQEMSSTSLSQSDDLKQMSLIDNLIDVKVEGLQAIIEIDVEDWKWKLNLMRQLFERMQSLCLPISLELIKSMIRLHGKAKQFDKIQSLAQILRQNNLFEGYYVECEISKPLNIAPNEVAKCLIQEGLLKLVIGVQVEQKYIETVLKCLNSQTFNKNPIYYYLDSHRLIQKAKLPYNFSWYSMGHLAGSSEPDQDELNIFSQMGIKRLITCLEKPLVVTPPDGLEISYFEVEDRRPPTLEQLEQMLEILDEGLPTVVHCQGGRGRTNVVLVCHLIRSQNLDVNQAIYLVKEKRPNLIFDDTQVEFITTFAKIHLSKQDDSSSSVSRPGYLKPKIKLPKLIMFVGLQASGKTTISKHMQEHFGDRVVRINQDELRHDSLDAFQDEAKSLKTIILDCCNLTPDKRKEWLALAFNAPSWCVFVDTPYEECQYRIVRRKGHQTIQEGGGLKVLESAIKKMEVPTIKEGYKRLFHLTKESEIDHFLMELGLPKIPISSGIHKFRRTPHLVRLGADTPDDEDCSLAQHKLFLQSVIEIHEKVDGANLGFSISAEGKVIAQNRSHYVCSTYHPQFKLLDKWIAQHTDDIFAIVEPETEILFGEWLYMKHSIHYTKLPSYFMAFDIYNRKTNRYLSREEMEKRIQGTKIVMVPLIAKKQFKSIDEIKTLVRQPSQFYDGPIEGLYLRICDPTTTLEYAKIVRHDFICGNDQGKVRHWCKEIPVKNLLNSCFTAER